MFNNTKTLPHYWRAALLGYATIYSTMPIFADEWKPPIDETQFEQELRAENPTMGTILREHRQSQLFRILSNTARQLFDKGDYEEALNYYRYLNKNRALTGDVYHAEFGEGACLEKLGREKEAIELYREDIAHGCDEDACAQIVPLLIKKKEYREAMAVCEKLSQNTCTSKGLLLKSMVLEASGDLSSAEKVARQAYYHCRQWGQDTKEASQRLAALKCDPETQPASNNSFTRQVLSYMHKFADMKTRPSQEEIRKTFGVEMRGIHRARQPESPYRDYISNTERQQPLIEVRYGNETLGKDGSILSFTVNPDFESITPAQIKKEFGETPFYPYSRSGCIVNGACMRYEKRRPAMQLDFVGKEGPDPPVISIAFTWHSDAEKAEPAAVSADQEKSFDPDKDPVVLKARAVLKHEHFAQARDILVKSWSSYPDGPAPLRLEAMRKRRALLVEALSGLKEKEVAAFVDQAPINIIHRVISQNLPERPIQLLTADEYSHKPWSVEGWTNSPTAGSFMFRWCGYAICPADGKSPNWNEYYKLFGPRPEMAISQIPVPTGKLRDMIDADDFHVGRE